MRACRALSALSATRHASLRARAAMSSAETAVRALVPSLSRRAHKGQAGKVGVVGGSKEYTGAPFFAAYSALRGGADLAHVFCCASAGPVIKSYSPELIVHPLLPEGGLGAASASEAVLSATAACTDWLSRLNALCIGPGLGRDEAALAVAEALLTAALERQLPCVLDGDGLWLVTRKPQLLAGQAAGRCVLTPNVNEFSRLTSALGIHTGGADAESALSALSAALGGAVIVQKGETDLIACGSLPVLRCADHGSPRRCGGQGDVLAGLTATFAAWAIAKARGDGEPAQMQQSALAACLVTRRAARLAFAARKRSMVAGDLIEHVGEVVEELAPAAHTAGS